MTRLRRSRISRIGLLVSAALLTAFHFLLLGARVVDGSFLDPAVAAEWVFGLTLLLGLMRLHRAGLSLVRGRGALILWLLVLVLHAVAVAPPDGAGINIEVDKSLLAIAPLSAAVGIAVARLAGLLLEKRRRFRAPLWSGVLVASRETRFLSPHLLSSFAPRGPPLWR